MFTIERTGISTQIFSGINIKHPVTGGKRIGIFTMAGMIAFISFLFEYPFHFRAYKLHDWR